MLTYLLSLKYSSKPDALLITLQLLSFSFFTLVSSAQRKAEGKMSLIALT